MARLHWFCVAAVATLAATPMACFVVDDHPVGPGGVGPSGAGPSGSGGSTGVGVGGGHGTGGSPAPSDACNPVTGAGCPSDGSTCDLDSNLGTFKCFPPPNSVDVCGTCDNQTAFCGEGLTCVIATGDSVGACFRYCCTDADCGGGTAKCDTALGASFLQPANPGDKVGLCVQGVAAACGPATPVSGGSCVAGYNPSTPDGGGAGGSTGHGSSSASSSSSGGAGGASGTGGSSGSGDAGPGSSSSSSGDAGAGGASSSSSASGTGGSNPLPPDGGSAGRGDGGP